MKAPGDEGGLNLNQFPCERLSYGLMSLWDMINFQVFGLCNLLKQLILEEHFLSQRIDHELSLGKYAKGLRPFLQEQDPTNITDADRERVTNLLQMAILIVTEMEMTASAHRITLFTKRLRSHIRLEESLAEARALREAIEGELRQQYFYRYPNDKSRIALSTGSDWKSIVDKFCSAKQDVISAVDCYAIGHGTACVFHLMRTAEYGLRALARERRVRLPRKQVLEWADWRTIIDGISKEAEKIANKKRGQNRDEALEFYRGALASFEGFKDAYRNNVMHSRKSYSGTEALSVMHHVRDFMSRLACKIDEHAKRQIKWGIRA
jgi:hypothetical protein